MVTSARSSPSSAPSTASTASTMAVPAPVASSLAKKLRRALAALHIIVAAAALLGGFALVTDPSGAPLGLTPAELMGFTSFALPGIFLVVLACLQGAAAWLVLTPGARGLAASQAAGALLVLWTAFQSTLTKPLHPLQLVSLLVAAVIFMVAHELYSDEPHRKLLP